MEDLQRMRASDRDRQEAVERLRAALDEGRLKMEEYVQRMGLAYEAVTYGDLAVLYADLPAAGKTANWDAAPSALPPPAPAPQTALTPRHGTLADLPTSLKVLWTIWLAAVSINVVVWVLVSATGGHLVYPWPVWVAGPSGAALLAVSAGATQIRRSRPSPARRGPAGKR